MFTVRSTGSHTAENNGSLTALALPSVSACLPEQFTAVGVILVVDCFLQNTAQMKGQPAESKNQHQAEHRLRYFPPLHRQRQILMLLRASVSPSLWVTAVLTFSCFHVYLFHVVVECDSHAFFAAEHLAGHERVEDSCAGQWEAEIEAKQPPVLHILVELEKEKGPHPSKYSVIHKPIHLMFSHQNIHCTKDFKFN